MSTPSATKPELWQQLKDAGITPDLHYRDYTAEKLQSILDLNSEFMSEEKTTTAAEPRPKSGTPMSSTPLSQTAGIHVNTHGDGEIPLREDPETGRVWYREEVRKPSGPQRRTRRVIQFQNASTVMQEHKLGDNTTESFEIPGEFTGTSEARISLPSYQVGLYKDPNDPFRTHIYDERVGFDFHEVNEYYGGAERVPHTIKRIYVSNELCYDVYTVHAAINQEYRERVLGIRN